MEAVPRQPMLWFPSKSSPEGTSFSGLKKYIAEFYQENPDNYSKELYALETLRNQALNTPQDNCALLKRYFCQLQSLLNRCPKLRDEKVIFQFSWKDLYNNKVQEYNDIGYEQAAVLYNIAAVHTQAGAAVNRTDIEGMKLACTHFQCAAWAFGEIRERYTNMNELGDCFKAELLVLMQQVSFAQAQECILEKALIDDRKPIIVAKVTAQIIKYYGAALNALLKGGDDGPVARVVDSLVYKQWKKYIRFKISYLNCILYLYQGRHAEDQRKMGERVTLYEAAWEKLEEARRVSKGLSDIKEINKSLVFTADVVEAKRKNAKNENEFIYHETVPELFTISAVQGANIVTGIGFSTTDPDVAGEDIFARLVPMKAHEASSMYSEEKAKLLRKYGSEIEQKDAELSSFMSTLTLDNLNNNEEKANKIPQGIVDRCAALNANKHAIPVLVQSMSRLAEICCDVEANLNEISIILQHEEEEEKYFQQPTGVQRTSIADITELKQQFQKYSEAHNQAGKSNDTLRKAMELHITNLKILSKPLREIQQSVPKLSSELNTTQVFKDVKLIVNKVNEMKAQRSQFYADLRTAVNDDDITSKIIAHDSEEELQTLFERELAKHEHLIQLIDQNLLAQENILKALTVSYAKAVPILKILTGLKNERESFFACLAESYDVYGELLNKLAKGLEFYNNLSAKVQKLLSRCKSARNVLSEERQRRVKSSSQHRSYSYTAPTDNFETSNNSSMINSIPTAPKLRDYMNAKKVAKDKNLSRISSNVRAGYNPQQNISPVRPNALGWKNPSHAICSSGSTYYSPTHEPNEQPLHYTQYYDMTRAGYTNPIFLQYQQNFAPPSYKSQVSTNSQLTYLNANMANLTLQQQQPTCVASATNQMMNAPAFGIRNQISCNAMEYNTPSFLSNNQNNKATVQQGYNINSQHNYTPLHTTPLNVNNTSNHYPVSAAPTVASNLPSNFLSSTQATVSNSAHIYPQPVATIASSTSYAPQTYYNTANNLNTNYPLNSQQNNYQTSTSGVPSNQAGLPSSTTHLQSAQNNTHVPLTMQLPYVFNNTHNQTSTLHTAPTKESVSQTVGNTTPYLEVFQPMTSTTIGVTTTTKPLSSYSTIYPGCSNDPQTGGYNYSSGYQQTAKNNNQFYGQYTTGLAAINTQAGTTDSETADKINLTTGFDSPIISHTKSTSLPPKPPLSTNLNYYNASYGYQINGVPSSPVVASTQITSLTNQTHTTAAVVVSTVAEHQIFCQQNHKYMQSASGNTSITQTTKAVNTYATSRQQSQMMPLRQQNTTETEKLAAMANHSAPTANTIAKPLPVDTRKSSNIDLLSDIDCSGIAALPPPILPEPALKPSWISSSPVSQIVE